MYTNLARCPVVPHPAPDLVRHERRGGRLRGVPAAAAVLAMLLSASPSFAQADLAGTWTLDQTGGRAGGRGGVPGFPLATTLVIKVSPTEVIVDSNTAQA